MRATTDEQYLADFREMSANGATAGGGVERQAASEGDRLNRAWFAQVLESMGARVHYDEIGNQYGLSSSFRTRLCRPGFAPRFTAFGRAL